MIKISNIRMSLDEAEDCLTKKVAHHLSIDPSEITSYIIGRKSIDARKKSDVHYIYSVNVEIENEGRFYSVPDVSKVEVFHFQYLPSSFKKRPVVIGFGPAGMFAALYLAESGAKPIVLERGNRVEERTKDVETLFTKGILNPSSNIQFGEGGAGTFSDGKLTTGIKNKACRVILETFVKYGAPEEILYLAKPHIGTDNLVKIVSGIRKRITELGGEIRFETKATDFEISGDRITGVFCDNEYIETDTVILAIGHSARDTFSMLHSRGFSMEQKPFAVGVRIEHLQEDISLASFGQCYKKLPPADYKLVSHAGANGVYTFCMCPGGEVVSATSEIGGVVTNGMSRFARACTNANSALLVGIAPDGSENPLRGIEIQRKMERAAYELGGGGYKAPVQLVGDFLQDKESHDLGDIIPSYRPGFSLCELRECLPKDVAYAIKLGISDMGRQLKGFDRYDATLTGVESRSSSPVRILRDTDYQSRSFKGLYPCGEGAGYAGGIVSAAVDGIECATRVVQYAD